MPITHSPTPSTLPTKPFTWLQPGTWRNPCIVHVTRVANGRRALFGTLTHNGTNAEVEKTSIGWALIHQQQRMLQFCPEIKILADKVMPDHHHIVLHVTRTMPRSIKEVLRGYMQGCKAEARTLGFTETLYDGPPYYRVLTHKGQLHAMIEYVKANAERAWQRKLHQTSSDCIGRLRSWHWSLRRWATISCWIGPTGSLWRYRAVPVKTRCRAA